MLSYKLKATVHLVVGAASFHMAAIFREQLNYDNSRMEGEEFYSDQECMYTLKINRLI